MELTDKYAGGGGGGEDISWSGSGTGGAGGGGCVVDQDAGMQEQLIQVVVVEVVMESRTHGGAGGSGIVIIRYKFQ